MGPDAITHADASKEIGVLREQFIVSQISRLSSPIRFLIGLGALVGTALEVRAQDIGPVSFRDSLVMRQIAYRTPCPLVVPPAWSHVDSTLGRGPRCSLVESAARAIAQYHQARAPRVGPADPWNPLCVRIVVGRNTGSTGLPGDWLVLFDLSPEYAAQVVIDRQTGEVGGVMVSYGEPAGDMPRCLSRHGLP